MPAAAPADRRPRGARHDPHRQERARRRRRCGSAWWTRWCRRSILARDGARGRRPAGARRPARPASRRRRSPGTAARPHRGGTAAGVPRGASTQVLEAHRRALSRAARARSRSCGSGWSTASRPGWRMEHRTFGELAVGDVSRKLVQIFFATTALKKDDGIPPGTRRAPRRSDGSASSARGSWARASPGTAVLNVEVDTRLKDADLARVGKGLRAATGILAERLKRRRLTRPQFERLSALLSGGADYSGFARADLVIEAVFEDLDAQAAGAGRGRGRGAARDDLRQQHLHHSHSRHRCRGRAGPSGCWACTSSRRSRRCRCWRSSPPRPPAPRRSSPPCGSAAGWARRSSSWPTIPASGSTGSCRPTSTRRPSCCPKACRSS